MRLWFSDVLERLRQNSPRFEVPGCDNVQKIADGGFSTVYRACQPQFRRWVAVKVLDPCHFNKQRLRSRFEQECETLGMLGDHPNVVRVFQAGISKAGSPYIIMEYLPAGSLADRLDAEGPLPWEEVCALGVKLAGALQSAHEAGVLHLDIKPANVLIGRDGEPKLADFGIARLRAALGVRTAQTLAFTPGYAGPELFEGDEPTGASDVYGLGATLFTLLAGHSPFLRAHDEAPNVEVVIGRMLFGPVPELDPGFPEALRAVVRRAMAKKVGDRFGSAAEFAEAIQAVQCESGLGITPLSVVPVAPIPSPPPPPVRHQPSAIVSALLVLLILVVSIGGIVAWWPDTCGRPKRSQPTVCSRSGPCCRRPANSSTMVQRWKLV
jgi:serine/threonine-protein kinase PknK